ncbi:MAG TPA: DNA primase [Coriobacteriia bacterium]|nr:DNA primase [Coriobacteriia bacterium]
MGRIPEDDVERVRDATDLATLVAESVVLKKKGRLYWGLCPFHGEKTPSFKVDPATQLWHCFGCGEGGDAFGFVMRREHLEFPEAARLLAARARIEIREEGAGLPRGHKERLVEACEAAAEYYHTTLMRSREAEADAARRYLAQRGIGTEAARRFVLGYAATQGRLVTHLTQAGFAGEVLVEANLAVPRGGASAGHHSGLKDRFAGRIIFPIRDVGGRVIAFGGRALEDREPKYLNTSETPIFHKAANLYAIDKAKSSIVAKKTAVVVEGYTDVIALHEAGIGNVVATLGTALTGRHMKVLQRFAPNIVCLFDGDAAGLRAADRASTFAGATTPPDAGIAPVELKVAVIPGGLDPADFVTRHGAEAMSAVIDEGVPALRYAIDRTLAQSDVTTPGGRAKALAEAAVVVAPVKGSILAHDYANYLADRLLVDFETVRAAIERARPAVAARTEDAEEASAVLGADIEVIDASVRAERALAGLIAADPSLRHGARSLLTGGVFADTLARSIVESAIEARSAVGHELYREIARRDERAAAALTGLLMDVPPEQEILPVARLTLAKVKELALERQIKEGKARQRALEAAGEISAADTLFREIASLTAEHARLRQGAVPEEAGVWDQ